MKKQIIILVIVLSTSVSNLLACPSGQHSVCVLPRPWPSSGCAQSICVPNVNVPGPSNVDFGSNSSEALNKVVANIERYTGTLGIPELDSIKTGLTHLSIRIDSNMLTGCAVAVGFTVANSVVAVASDCAASGVSNGSGITTGNACGDAAASAVLALGLCTNLSNEQKNEASFRLKQPGVKSWMISNRQEFNRFITLVNTKLSEGKNMSQIFRIDRGPKACIEPGRYVIQNWLKKTYLSQDPNQLSDGIGDGEYWTVSGIGECIYNIRSTFEKKRYLSQAPGKEILKRGDGEKWILRDGGSGRYIIENALEKNYLSQAITTQQFAVGDGEFWIFSK